MGTIMKTRIFNMRFCMDNIVFSNTDDYVAGFSDEQVEWMRPCQVDVWAYSL